MTIRLHDNPLIQAYRKGYKTVQKWFEACSRMRWSNESIDDFGVEISSCRHASDHSSVRSIQDFLARVITRESRNRLPIGREEEDRRYGKGGKQVVHILPWLDGAIPSKEEMIQEAASIDTSTF